MNRRSIVAATGLIKTLATLLGVTAEPLPATHLQMLAAQSVPESAILGADERGVPRICGVGLQSDTESGPELQSDSSALPAGMRLWECIPNVIRNDGVESFRLEVDVNGPVNQVSFRVRTNYLVAQSGLNTIALRDDGLNGDRISGDYIFTSEPIRYRVAKPMPPYHGYTTNAIPGAAMQPAGFVDIVESNNATTQFLNPPCVGFLNTNIPSAQVTTLAANIQATTHFINIAATGREAQKTLRYGSGSYVSPIAAQVYSVLPDAFDFLSFLSTDHLEFLPSTTTANFRAGLHIQARRLFTGTGQSYYNPSIAYGSTNRLQGLNTFAVLNYGYDSSYSAFHEYMHLWAASTSTSLGLTSDGSHYRQNCSAFSPVGGFKATFVTNSGVVFVRRDCIGHTNAPPIDKYMMGLVPTTSVPTLYVMTNYPNINCGNLDYFTNAKPVTIANIVAVHGVRSPGPASAQRQFSIGFVAGSYQRLLNATEMTFYDYVAEYFTRALPPGAPAPALWDGYVPISKYVGEGVTWSSKGLGLIQPVITNMQWTATNFRADGTGYPGRNYRLFGSTNLTSWTQITNKPAGTNGAFSLLDNSQPRPTRRWYKVSTP